MRYTPVELRHIRIERSKFGGYKRPQTDQMIVDIADSFEDVWRERGELADKLEDVERALSEVKQRESLLAATLVAAEKTAAEAIESAKRQSELIVAEAHQEARSITRAGQSERERLFAEVRRVETLLRAALGMVEETRSELPSAASSSPGRAVAEASPQTWPNRQDTREFAAVRPPVAAAAAAPPSAPTPAPAPAKLPPVQEIVPEDDDDGTAVARDFAWG